MASPAAPTSSAALGQREMWKGKRPNQNGDGRQVKKKFRGGKGKKVKAAGEGSLEEVLLADIQALLASQRLDDDTTAFDESAERLPPPELPQPGSEIEVDVVELSSTGDGLARQKGSDRIYTVPFAVPGDTVRVKVYRHLADEGYSVADFLSVTTPSPDRDDARIRCRYFAQCSGCQFQMLDYAHQLRLKQRIVERAYRHFSQLPPARVPPVADTMASPLQYGYRTKLTPHFDGPPGSGSRNKAARKAAPPWGARPPIGFTPKGRRNVLDIEDCPIGTDAVRGGLTRERDRLAVEYSQYQRGATILLRESTARHPHDAEGKAAVPASIPTDAIVVAGDGYTDVKTCITNNNATSTEYIDDYIFTNPAGAFFQNNNSILPAFTAYVRERILPTSTPAAGPAVRYLIDAYSGSGLFTIALAAQLPGGSLGIDIADKSIAFARRNAALNGLPEDRCAFLAADAPALFEQVTFPPAETAVVVDPPRKGCDASFLRQLLAFGPARVVYVSCNVHTQARDVGVLVRGEVDRGDGQTVVPGARYEIESLRGFDFFPQTGHVEGVAVLTRVPDEEAPEAAEEQLESGGQ